MGKEREAQIDRVNEQVKDLYGPLLSCVTASKSAFDAMIGQHSPDGTKAGFVRAIRENPDSAEAVAYRYIITKGVYLASGLFCTLPCTAKSAKANHVVHKCNLHIGIIIYCSVLKENLLMWACYWQAVDEGSTAAFE